MAEFCGFAKTIQANVGVVALKYAMSLFSHIPLNSPYSFSHSITYEYKWDECERVIKYTKKRSIIFRTWKAVACAMGVEWKLRRPSQKRVGDVMWVSGAAPYKTSCKYPPASQRTESVQWVGWPSAAITLTLAVVRVVCAWCVFCLHGSLVLLERRQPPN